MFIKSFSQYCLLVLVVTQLALVGCSSNSENRPKKADTFDGIVRPPKEQIDIFVNGQLPSKPYKAIKIFSEKSSPGREAKMADAFVKKAKALGADGIIINPTQYGGMDIGPVNANTLSVYSATAIVYQ